MRLLHSHPGCVPDRAEELRTASARNGQSWRRAVGFLNKMPGHRKQGSVLIIVLWVAIGLVSITLYFANSMSFELRASDNRVSGLAADQAIEGAARYVGYVLSNRETNGWLPDPASYQCEAVPVGDAHFWLIGRETNVLQNGPLQPVFGLVDEASRLNLNTAPSNMIVWLPRMTLDLVSAILDWRTNSGAGGGTQNYYARLRPPYQCKSSAFETVDELRLVFGADMEILYGEDANLNGILDANENDGDATLPYDNRDNRLDPGILEYFTVYSREPNTRSDGSPRINVSSGGGGGGGGGAGGGGGGGGRGGTSNVGVASLLQTNFGVARANEILALLGSQAIRSPLEFYTRSQMKPEEFGQIANDITVSSGAYLEGRVNVNTASATVLACLLDGDVATAQQLVSYRQMNTDKLTSIAWVVEALGQNNTGALQSLAAGDYITTQSYQFTADVAALGPHGRGYRRTRFVIDTCEGTPKILYRQDLSHLGWALGRDVRSTWLLAKEMR